jgi:hypothetical protein
MKIKKLLILSLIGCGILSAQAQKVNSNDIKIGLPIVKPITAPTEVVPYQTTTISAPVFDVIGPGVNNNPSSLPSVKVDTIIKPTSPVNPTEAVTLIVKHQVQESMLCMPTSASMMLSKLGWNFPPRQIKLASLGKTWYGPNAPFSDYTGMSFMQLQTALQKLGIRSMATSYSDQNFAIGFEDIKNSIRRGYPVVLGTTYYGTVGHAVLVIGFDERNKKVIIDNPAYKAPGIEYYSYDDMKNKYWNNKFYGQTTRTVLFMKDAGIPYR